MRAPRGTRSLLCVIPGPCGRVCHCATSAWDTFAALARWREIATRLGRDASTMTQLLLQNKKRKNEGRKVALSKEAVDKLEERPGVPLVFFTRFSAVLRACDG